MDRVLIPTGHLFLWVDKFHLCQGISNWIENTTLSIVDMIVWDKDKMGMGYRSRRQCEYLIVLLKNSKNIHYIRQDKIISSSFFEILPTIQESPIIFILYFL